MNNIKAIAQLEDLKVDRLSFIHNNELDAVFLNDIKAINLAINKNRRNTKERREREWPIIKTLTILVMMQMHYQIQKYWQ